MSVILPRKDVKDLIFGSEKPLVAGWQSFAQIAGNGSLSPEAEDFICNDKWAIGNTAYNGIYNNKNNYTRLLHTPRIDSAEATTTGTSFNINHLPTINTTNTTNNARLVAVYWNPIDNKQTHHTYIHNQHKLLLALSMQCDVANQNDFENKK